MPKRFVSEPIEPADASFDPETLARGEPALPAAFRWRDELLSIASTAQMRKSTKVDRGDTYVKRHYFDVILTDGRKASIYFERQAKRNHPRWHLYTLED
ncbi:MAG TPA: DUF6504 family protein [Candidatus Baltobacteraceae bacterium]|jgi:phosphoribosylglycinamide formyltransferase-1